MSYPLGAPIYTPTDKYTEDERSAGIQKARQVFESYEASYQPKLKLLKKLCEGYDTCVVIGNGPSLNKTDLSLLEGFPSFGANSIFLKFPSEGFRPSFYLVEDHLVAEDRCDSINAIDECIKLFPTYLAYCIDLGPLTVFYRHLPRKSFPHGFDFSQDASENTYTGCTVTFSALQLAYYFGFKRILLVGLDHNYDLPKDLVRKDTYGVGVLDMKSDDPNHFDPDYFGKGRRWHDPQVEKMEAAYLAGKEVFGSNGVDVLNCTVGGKLEVFPRMDLEAALAGSASGGCFERDAFIKRFLEESK